MYKAASRFLRSQSSTGRSRGRFNTQMSTSAHVGRQDRHNTHHMSANGLAQRLDAEVARSQGKEIKAGRPRPQTARPRKSSVLEEGSRLYLVLFTLRSDATKQFLKVGISRYDVRARFRGDMIHFDVNLVAESAKMDRRDAKALEHAIHTAFRKSRRYPPVRLMSGNTECYGYTEENVMTFAGIVQSV